MKALTAIIFLSLTLMASSCSRKSDPESDCGFIKNEDGQRVSWNSRRPIPIFIDASVPSQYHDAIRRAMASWERALGAALFQYGGVVSSYTPRQDGANVIYWLPSWDRRLGRQQADTLVYWVSEQIIEADVRVNAQDFSFSDGQYPGTIDVESLILHELGHVLGLAHADGSQTVMSPYLSNSYLRRNVSWEDLSNLKCEY